MKKNLQTVLSKNNFLFSFAGIVLLGLALLFLFSGCKKKPAAAAEAENSAESEVTEAADLTEGGENADEDFAEFNFYSPALDNADWVEELLARIEEERIAEELSSMEESLEEYQNEGSQPENQEGAEASETEGHAKVSDDDTETTPEDNTSTPELSDVEKFFAEEKSGEVRLEKNSQLKFFEFDNEIFSQQTIDGNTVIAQTDGKSVSRNFYDEKYQLVKKESWSIASAANALLEKSESFEYFEDSPVVSVKKIKEKDFAETVNYNKEGKLIKSEKYAEQNDQQYIVSKRSLAYNTEGLLSSDELTEYFYKDADYSELDYSFTKKYSYAYNEGDIPPDFKYYENNELKMHNKYSTVKGSYTSHIYFDDAFSVKTYYENEIRVKDVYYSGNKVMREKVYEKIEPSVQSE